MRELYKIRFSFICRKTYTNEEGKFPIVFRITYMSDRKDLFTGLYCAKGEWNPEAGRLFVTSRQATSLNQNLEKMIYGAHQCFDELRFGGEDFTLDDISDKIKGVGSKPILLIDFLEEEVLKIKKRVGIEITRATYIKYKTIISHLKDFLQAEFKVKNFVLRKIDGLFLDKFFHFLRIEKKISHNTTIKYIKSLKTIMMTPVKMNVFKRDPFSDLKLSPKIIHKDYLIKDELKLLTDYKFDSKDLERIRDLFLFSCYTGLAYSDLKQLEPSHITCDSDGSCVIRKPRQKTNQESIVPLLPQVMNLLKKYSPTGNIKDFRWHVSSNQKMNERLKTIAVLVGINKKLHMHLARHTFATTVTLSNGIPLETVSSMLGHSNIKQTQHYAKIVAAKVKADMAKLSDLFF